jgi:GNAT superfamily N-acetyltransferase
MIFREALISDIPQIQIIRHAVKENRLSDPSLVSDKDVEDYITRRGKGWVCEMDGRLVGFSIVDLVDHNVWALFIDPQYEGRGIGRRLHHDMIDWYFTQMQSPIWLGTAPDTRAEAFYRRAGWKHIGQHGKGEIKFGLSKEEWIKNKSLP